MKRFLYTCTLAFALAACGGDDVVPVAQQQGTEAPAGPANQVDASVSGGSTASGDIDGSSETSAEGQFYATVTNGIVTVWVGSSTSIVNFMIDTAGAEVPSAFAITAAPDGNNLTVTNGLSILEGTGGTVSIDFCPNTQGDVIAGSFNGVALTNVATQSADGALNGSYRATIVLSDGSVTCKAPETPIGGGDVGGETCTLDETCDGPCCPYMPSIVQCQQGCVMSCINMMDPSDMSGCVSCFDDCIASSGALEDAACRDAMIAFDACENNSGCDELIFDEGDGYDRCIESNCCAEMNTAL